MSEDTPESRPLPGDRSAENFEGPASVPAEGPVERPADPPLPTSGCLLGIDFGTKRIGVAYCDALQIVATPLRNYRRGTLVEDERFFQAVISELTIVGAVVGLPLHISGDPSRKSREARRFAAWLGRKTGLPIAFQDERYSSVQAEAHMAAVKVPEKQRPGSIDMVAAQIILNDFLRSRSSSDT